MDMLNDKLINRQTQETTNVGSFERFVPALHARASLYATGTLAFNAASCDIYGILDYTHYIGFYDRDTCRIGILFTNDKYEPGARSFRRMNNYALLSVRTFFDFYGIDMAKRHFDISEGDGGMLILEEVKS